MLEGLDVVIGETNDTEQKRGDYHQNGVDAMKFAYQQNWYQNGRYDGDAAHGRNANFLGVVGVNGFVTLGFNDFFPFQHLDEEVAEPYRNDKRQDNSCGCPEGDIIEHARTREAVLVQIIEQIV